MFQQAGTAQLNDYFRPLSERGGPACFSAGSPGTGRRWPLFCAATMRRPAGPASSSTAHPNPTPDNLSYFNEMMGSGFQMDRDFLSQRLKKWLPRMTDGSGTLW